MRNNGTDVWVGEYDSPTGNDASVTSGNAITIGLSKTAFAVTADSAQMAANGILSAEDVEVTTDCSLTRLAIGCSVITANREINGHIQRFAYWPARLSGAALQNLSSTGQAFDFSGGLPVSPDGALLVSYDQTPVKWVAGIPLDANGLVCCATPVPPLDLSGFDSGFDGGFG